jgi:hypothetical protein
LQFGQRRRHATQRQRTTQLLGIIDGDDFSDAGLGVAAALGLRGVRPDAAARVAVERFPQRF